MKIRELTEGISFNFLNIKGEPLTDEDSVRSLFDREITAVTNDSRKVGPGTLFFCIEGSRADGHDFAAGALEKGACALVVRRNLDLSAVCGEGNGEKPLPAIIQVEDSRLAMAEISAAFYRHPSKELKMIGVTGTKGKTTTTYMIRSILEDAGIRTGLVGTIETVFETAEGTVRTPAANTTPESIILQKTLRDMADSGIQAVVMEVSSQALMLHRTAGVVFDLGIFTNLSPDHIGPHEHRDFEEYLHCKSLLFRQCRTGIVNGDDPYCGRILEGHSCRVETYGLGEDNFLSARSIGLIHTPGELGVEFDIVLNDPEKREMAPVSGEKEKQPADQWHSLHVRVPAPGRFSVYNALCAAAVCRHFHVSGENIQKALRQVHVRGRIEMVKVSDDFTLMIDYAHNAMALESLLTTLREYETGRLVCVFGCGGDRARSRRFEMGEVSGRLSDLTIITSDNPRSEEPEAIIADIVTGLEPTGGRYMTITDRKEAVRFAIKNGQPGDIIVLAGKGHEDYQEIKGVKYPMDERVMIREILQEEGISPNGAASPEQGDRNGGID